jgi:hypothetical protein
MRHYSLTKDEKLVLAHDDDFSRLALDKDLPHKQVRDLTFRELISLPLKSGIRPPLLIDVLLYDRQGPLEAIQSWSLKSSQATMLRQVRLPECLFDTPISWNSVLL